MRDRGNGGGKKPKMGQFIAKHQSSFIVVCASFWLCNIPEGLGINALLRTLAYGTTEPCL